MPEGPEVKAVADVIAKSINREFVSADILENIPSREHRFAREGIDRWIELQQPWTITAVETFGKMIKFDIKTPYATICAINTLGMSGTWAYNARRHKHGKITFIAKDGGDLTFIDIRNFGTFKLVSPEEAKPITAKIGWDLLKAPMPVDQWAKLQKNSKIRHRPIGPVLLEQNLFAGLGNIYRAETLYSCGVNPHTFVGDVPADKWAALNPTAHQILKTSYELGGTSIETFEADGRKGSNEVKIKVYGKKTCPEGHKVSSAEMKGRRMWWCELCQPATKLQNTLF